MIKKLSLKRVVLEGIEGNFVEVTPVNILNRTHLFKFLEEIQNYLSELSVQDTATKSFHDIWDEDPYFQHICCEAVRYGGLDPDTLTLDMIYCLLLPFYDEVENAHYHQGILVALNFSPNKFADKTGTGENNSDNTRSETLAQMLAGLWTSADSVGEAIQLIEQVPADELIEVLKHRADIVKEINMTPEQKKAREQKAMRDKLKEKFAKKQEERKKKIREQREKKKNSQR